MFTWVRALTYSVMFIGLMFVFLPGQLLEWTHVTRPSGTGPPQIVGAVLVILGGGLAVWCILTFAHKGRGTPAPFDPPRRLVVSGPYRWVRNPMYWGAVLILSGAALYYRSAILAGYAAFFFVAIDLFVRGYEEPTLYRLFGAEYTAYCGAVRRWWPTPSRARKSGA